jgi:hypothetical protein
MQLEFLRSNMGVAIVVLVVFIALMALRSLLFGREGMDDGKSSDGESDGESGVDAQTDTDAAATDEPKPTESAKDPNSSFCTVAQSLAEREQACLALDKDGCGLAGCCVWATASAGDKTQQLCVAGDASGPTFLSEPGSSSLYNITGYAHDGKTYSQSAPAKTGRQAGQSGQKGQGDQANQASQASQGNQTESIWKELTGANVSVAAE